MIDNLTRLKSPNWIKETSIVSLMVINRISRLKKWRNQIGR
jgi:hypothetical protein